MMARQKLYLHQKVVITKVKAKAVWKTILSLQAKYKTVQVWSKESDH